MNDSIKTIGFQHIIKPEENLKFSPFEQLWKKTKHSIYDKRIKQAVKNRVQNATNKCKIQKILNERLRIKKRIPRKTEMSLMAGRSLGFATIYNFLAKLPKASLWPNRTFNFDDKLIFLSKKIHC